MRTLPHVAGPATQGRAGGSAASVWSIRIPLCFILGLMPLHAGLSRSETTNDLISLSQLRAFTTETNQASRPFRVRGIVVCHDGGWHQLYVHDGKETEYFNADDFPAQPELGDLVEISGSVGSTGRLTNLSLTQLGNAPLPGAQPLEPSELAHAHGQWIQTTGRVLAAETSRGRLALLLHEKGQNFLLYVLGTSATNGFKQLLDCRVQVRGINASRTMDGRLDTPLVFVPGMPEITVLRSATTNPPVPVVSIGSLLNRELGSWTNRWVHINGLTVGYQPGRSLVVKDPTGTIRARVIQQTELPRDERVDVWGFLEVSPEETLLNQAYFAVTRLPASPEVSSRAPSPGAPAQPLPEVIARLSEIHQLSREDAAQHIPVRLRGVLTYADPNWRNGFIQDKGDALYVDLDPTQKELQSGQWVELTGETSPGGFAPEVINSRIQVLGSTNLPPPARLELEDLANGHWDAHWVEMEGVVRRVDEQTDHLNLSVMTPGGRFRVIIPQLAEPKRAARLIDAFVRVQGACTSELNTRRQLSGITLHAPSLDQVNILEPAPADPFVINATRIDAVATFDPGRLAGRRVKLRGVVTLRMAGQGFYLQDAAGGMLVLSRQTNEVHMGDAVEVLGFPAIGNFSPQLEEAVFRKLGTEPLPPRKRTSAEQILLQGTNDSQVVELRARLLQSIPRSAHPQLVLQDGPIIFSASLEAQTGRLEVPALESGTLLRLKGVCAIQGGERHEPVTFRLLLRQLDDIEVLETPPWWTSRHSFMLAGGLMLAAAVAFAWVGLLRRQVHTQTEVIRQKLEEEEALEREILEISNREQRRIGHDLHDGVCQQLAGIAFMTSTLADELEEQGGSGAGAAERICTLINEVIDQTRGVARGLFPVRLEEKGLVFALEDLAANASELYKVNCQFVAEAPPPTVGNAMALHLYYIAIEAVANAAKHAAPRSVVITLAPAAGRYQLRVVDDGQGFSRPVNGHSGMGIRIMQYRARVIGATLSLQSQPGSGTSVTCLFVPDAGATVPPGGAGERHKNGAPPADISA